MRPRLALVVPVVGALLVGGAVTGTTFARWLDVATASTSSVTSGTLRLTGADGTTTTGLNLGSAAGLPVGTSSTPGTAVLVSPVPVLKHATAAASKNARMTVYVDAVTVTGTGLPGSVQVAVTSVAATGTCPATTTATFQDAAAGFTPVGVASALAPQASIKLCTYLRLKANAPAGALGKSGSLAMTLRGQQVRP